MMPPEKPRSAYQFFKNIDRVISLSDGIFGFAITLMVLFLTVPEVAKDTATTELPLRLIGEWPTFLIYFISFLIIGQWWMGHYRIFQHIKKVDQTLIWLNFLFLFFITLIPFQTTLIIQYPETPAAVIFYAITQAFAGIVLVVIWYYASHDQRLSEPDLTQGIVHYNIILLLVRSVVFLLSIGIAAVNTYIAEVSWIFIGLLLWRLSRWVYRKELLVSDQIE